MLKTLLHETQHAVQDIEGLAMGSSPEAWEKSKKSGKNEDSRSSYQLYYSTAGEIEARDVANRTSLTAEQRKNTRPDNSGSGVCCLFSSIHKESKLSSVWV